MPWLNMLWDGRCSVIVRQEKFDPVTKKTGFFETVLFTDKPCHLTYNRFTTERVAALDKNSHASKNTITIKLFLSPEIIVPAGSTVVVTQSGVTKSYCNSGEAAIYPSHQEVPLKPLDIWA